MWIQRVPGGGVESLCFAPDGKTVYTADAKWWVTAWPVGGAKGRRLFRPLHGLRGLFFMGGDRFLVARSSNGDVYDVTAGGRYARLGLNSTGSDSMRPLPGDDNALLIQRGNPQTWNVNTRKFGPEPPGWVTYGPTRDFDLAPDGRTGVQLPAHGDVLLVDLTQDGEITTRLDLPYGVGDYVKFAPDGATVVVFQSQKLGLWNPKSGKYQLAPKVVYTARSEAPLLPVFAFHPTEPVFAALNKDLALSLFDLNTGKLIRSFDFALGNIQCVAFAPDGLTCAVGGMGRFAVFDVDL